MHLYVMARGIVDRLNRWENNLLSIHYPYEYKKGEIGHLQLAVRPVRLYEIVFPEAMKDRVLERVQPYDSMVNLQHYEWFLRKILKLQPLENKPKTRQQTIDNQFVSCVGIGLKKDDYDKDGIELL